VLTFFGFMHGEAIGLAVTPAVAIAYLIVAVFIYGLSRYPQMVSIEMAAPKPMAHPAPAE
jgi:adenine/guanine/hypoxanthine permease